MNKYGILMFLAGAAVGALCTKLYFDEKEYQRQSEEADRLMEESQKIRDEAVAKQQRIREEAVLQQKIMRWKPCNLATTEEDMKQHKLRKEDLFTRPFVISAEQFFCDDMNTYKTLTVYYNRQEDTLVTSEGIPLDDMRELIGEDFKNRFEQDGDIVYVRNHKEQTDYEIVLDLEDENDEEYDNEGYAVPEMETVDDE